MHASTVLILHANPFVARLLHDRITAIYPTASCHITTRIGEAMALMGQGRTDYFFTHLDAADGDVLDFLLHRSREGKSLARSLVVTEPRGIRTLVTLWRLGIGGVFDLSEEPQSFTGALAAMESPRRYWSPNFSAALLSADARLVQSQLTPTEQLALGLMSDGCSDKEMSGRLNMTLRTVSSLRQDLHAKLKVHDKQGLQRAAARLGYARLSATGVVPMGAAQLIAEYMERSQRPVALPAALLDQFGFRSAKNPFGSNPPFRKSG